MPYGATTAPGGAARRGFTLIELLAIIALVGAMTGVAVFSVVRGRTASRVRGAVRDVFATVRQARSVALVTGQPAIITYATKKTGDGDDSVVSSAEIVSADMTSSSSVSVARTIDGEQIRLHGDEGSGGEGHTVEEMLFQPISEELMKGVRLKVVMRDELPETGWRDVDEARKSAISAFSNVDFILGTYKEAKARQEEEKKKAAGETSAAGAGAADAAAGDSAAGSADEIEEPRSIVWQANGRCEPHIIYVWPDGVRQEDSWRIVVDAFGKARILSPEERE